MRSDSASCGLFSNEEDGEGSLLESELSLRVLRSILPLLTTLLESESEADSEESLGFLFLSAWPLRFVLVLEPKRIMYIEYSQL